MTSISSPINNINITGSYVPITIWNEEQYLVDQILFKRSPNASDERLNALAQDVWAVFHHIERAMRKSKSVTLDPTFCQEQLVTLARLGRRAYFRFFEEKAQQMLALRFQTEVMPAPTFISDVVPFPWEVLYEGDYRAGEAEMFWGFRYAPARILDSNKDLYDHVFEQAQPVNMLFCLHHKLRHARQEGEAISKIVKSTREGQFHLLSSTSEFKNVSDGETLLEYLDQSEHNILHFACPCRPNEDGTNSLLISLVDDTNPRVIELETYNFEDVTGHFQSQPLVFINGPESARGTDKAFNLVRMLYKRGTAAIIATFCAVPDLFAAAFATKFYEFFLRDGLPIGEALRHTRLHFLEEHNNPLGLAYGLYGPAHYRVTPQPVAALPPTGSYVPITILSEEQYLVGNIPFKRSPMANDKHFNALAREVRSVIDNFARATNKPQTMTLDPAFCQTQLVKLAKVGRRAYSRFFERRAQKLLAERFQAEVMPAPTFISDVVPFPWEVLYEGDYRAGEAEMFWGVRYTPARILDSNKDLYDHVLEQPQPVNMLFCLHHELRHGRQEGEAINEIVKSTWEGQFHLLAPKDKLENVSNGETLLEYLYQSEHNILHFACHSGSHYDGPESLVISLIDETNPRVIELNTYHFSDVEGYFQSQPLVFLNTDQSGTDNALNFARHFYKRGAAAIIAPFCSVPDLFAAAFATKFYEFFLHDRLPIGEALRRTRLYFLEEYNNPLGLAYCLYGPAHYRVTLPPIADPPLIDEPFNDVVVDVQLELPDEPVLVGEEFEVGVSLRPGGRGEGRFCSLSIPKNRLMGGEINLFLEPQGLQVRGSKEDSLPLMAESSASRELDRQIEPQALFTVSASRPGMVEIRVDLYFEESFRESLVGEVEVEAADLVEIKRRVMPRPVPQPDLVLQVASEWYDDGSAVRFRYRLDGFRGASLQMDGLSSPWLAVGWLEQVRGLLGLTIEGIGLGLAADARARLKSFGRSLYREVLDDPLQKLFKRAAPGHTLLIVADQEAWLPWELLHDGRGFLGERFLIGRWPRESDDSRPYEFPIGAVSVAHYASIERIEEPQMWAQLLKPPFEALEPEILSGGVLDLKHLDRLRGLHLIRRAQLEQRNLPVPIKEQEETMAKEVQMSKLSLRRNRPLVTLSYLSAGQGELTQLTQSWAPTYINAGCSAFIGPLWAVDEAVEAAFVGTFYAQLWKGGSLGEAFRQAQKMARVAVPERLDWLAYILFGDPMARPYRPVKGNGYAVVEPVGRQKEDPVSAGASARFRVKLRRTPPVWHEDRVIEVADELQFDDLQVHIIALDLTIKPGSPIEMVRTPEGDYLGWCTLVVPDEITDEAAHVQVYFVDGERMVHRLMFWLPLKVREGNDERL